MASEDRTVHPDLERFVAKRMGATTTELKSSHVPILSQPGAVLDVIAVVAKQDSPSFPRLERSREIPTPAISSAKRGPDHASFRQ